MADKRKFTFPDALWAGTEHSLDMAMDVHELMMAGMFDQTVVAAGEDPIPYNFSQQGAVGIVSIRGPLVNNDSEYNRYRGVTSYADVRRAMIYAATQEGVKAILLDVDSGGGSVSGVDDAGALIAAIDKSVKPVYAYTGGQMASAAYWLGVSARGVYMSQTAMIGSIGVIATHKSYARAFKEAGIDVTVMRAGEFKALANGLEALTPEAKAQIDAQLQAAYQVFASHVAAQLGTPMDQFEKTMGQGREFFGAAGVEVGLAKGVKSFDGMMSFMTKHIDNIAKKEQTAGNYPRGSTMIRQALTEQQIAAMAAGGGIVAPDAAAVAAATLAETEAAAALAAKAEADALAAAAAGKVTEPQQENAGVIAFLQAQIKDKDATILAQTVELAGVKSKVASIEANHADLMKIAATSVSNMKIGLGLSKVDLSAMAPELLLAEHASTSTAFAAAFKVGGVAAITPPEKKDEAQAPSAMHMARIAATQFSHPNTK